jgi:hypothetical protein
MIPGLLKGRVRWKWNGFKKGLKIKRTKNTSSGFQSLCGDTVESLLSDEWIVIKTLPCEITEKIEKVKFCRNFVKVLLSFKGRIGEIHTFTYWMSLTILTLTNDCV